MKTKFYAVCDDVGVCNLGDEDYQTQKAIFFSRVDALRLIDNNKDKCLHIKEIFIIEEVVK